MLSESGRGLSGVEVDYVIIGCGASGMAFADVMLSENPSATLAMVDRQAAPGGHWNDAYSFIALHLPATYYGVPSEPLGRGGADLATGPEIVAYYGRVMEKFLNTGRVHYYPLCDYLGDGRVVSRLARGREVQVTARKRVVYAGYLPTQVPSTCPPAYEVAAGVSVVSPNQLARCSAPHASYIVIGAGKTGLDTLIFLLKRGVAPDQIQWICPNGAWLQNRERIQPGHMVGTFIGWMSALASSTTIEAVFAQLEREGFFMRIDETRQPTKYSCASVDRHELAALRRISNVVRLGRVMRIEATEITLEQGRVPVAEQTLFVNCTAPGLARLPPKPVFEAGRITIQALLMCQTLLGAATIAHVAELELSDEERNRLCKAIPYPEVPWHFVACMTTGLGNLIAWNRVMARWLRGCSLNFLHAESMVTLLLRSFEIKKLLPRALKQGNRILGQEVPWHRSPRGLASARLLEAVAVDALDQHVLSA